MFHVLQDDGSFGAKRRHALVCLLLPLMLLCNPFLAAPGSSNGALSLHHPPSYRATVASSELLKFRNPEGLDLTAFAACDLSHAFALLTPPLRASLQQSVANECLPPPDQFLSGNLWFRPPPTV